MTPTDSEISTTPEIAVGIQFHAQYDIKSAPVFLSADGEVFWLLLPSLVSLISGGTVQPENTYSCKLKVKGQVWESQKRISININHSYCQHWPSYVSLNWCNEFRFSFNPRNRKRLAARLVHVIKNLPIRYFYCVAA